MSGGNGGTGGTGGEGGRALDPRTPVVVGVGQVTNRPDPAVPADRRPQPLDLMVQAVVAAVEDCDGVAPGAAAPAGRRLLERTGSLGVVASFGWDPPNPGLLVAGALGIEPAEVLLSGTGGNTPQSLLHRAARAIGRGELDVAVVTGAEALYTRMVAARRQHPPVRLGWATQDPATTPAPVPFGDDRDPATDAEVAAGVALPVQAYPLLENALRAARGWTLEEHRAAIGRLWSGFSVVAAGNPYAWLPRAMAAEEIMAAGPANRMIGFPYPKLCTANLMVDQSAAYLCCSVAAARAAGVPEDRWVFPLSGADAVDHWYLSERPDLHRSPAIRLAGRDALASAGIGVDDVDRVDLYSCFPVVVQMAAAELGLATDDADRPLTVTGGLTFGGGPGNNYTAHGIATTVRLLRERPGSVGLVTGLGWYATKHAVGLYASRPPAHGGRDGFRWSSPQAEVDALPRCPVDDAATGPVTVETYTVTYDRDGRPDGGIAACRTAAGARTWARITDADDLGSVVAADGIGRTGTVGTDRVLKLS
ncbi:MAG TPA: acetyl-CoA acetyltransferase [Acidimicrobiales bacterium]|nr:acetyl-CoA acetyltransferase [Acidimicrobiales bacterium]